MKKIIGIGIILIALLAVWPSPEPAYASLWKVLTCRWGSGAGEVDEVRIDASTNSLQTISYEHHEIHAGSSFTCHFANDVTNIGEMTVIAFSVPDTTKWIHATMQISSTGSAYGGIYEATSIDDNEGQDLTVYNRNRNSATATTVISIEDPAVAGGATSFVEAEAATANITTSTELAKMYIGSTTRPGASVGGGSRGTQEVVLDQGAEYAFLLYSLTNDDATHNITVDWYEHTNKHN